MSRIWNIQNTYQNFLKANILRRLKRYCFTESCKGNEEGACTVCGDEGQEETNHMCRELKDGWLRPIVPLPDWRRFYLSLCLLSY